jgi:hypothetical protein
MADSKMCLSDNDFKHAGRIKPTNFRYFRNDSSIMCAKLSSIMRADAGRDGFD